MLGCFSIFHNLLHYVQYNVFIIKISLQLCFPFTSEMFCIHQHGHLLSTINLIFNELFCAIHMSSLLLNMHKISLMEGPVPANPSRTSESSHVELDIKLRHKKIFVLLIEDPGSLSKNISVYKVLKEQQKFIMVIA